MNSLLQQCQMNDVVLDVSTWNPVRDGHEELIHYIDLSSVDQEAKVICPNPPIVAKEAPSRARQLVQAGDVLVSTVRPNLNGVAMVDKELDGATASTGFCVLRPNKSKLNGSYLFHWVKTPEFISDMVRKATGASYPAVSDRIVLESKIPLPPIAEQKRIAAILDKADELRGLRRKALEELDAIVQSIFLEMFGDPATNPKSWVRCVLTKLCDTPDDIKCGPFGTQLNCEEYQESGIPLWGIKHVNAHFGIQTYEFVSESKAKDLAAYSLQAGDIVMTRKGTIGNCAVYPKNFTFGIMHSDLLRVRVSLSKADPIFLSHQLHYSRDVEHQLALIGGGAVMPGINVTKLKGISVVAPPLSLQKEFARRVEAIEQLKATHRESLAQLDALFASLQHRAFRGEL
jgi:type I restriction enzyme S subunit